MSKRKPTSVLTHETNLEEEEEFEDSGEFQKADNDELGKRVIKVAKRRSTTLDTTTPSPLVNFTGFGVAKEDSTKASSSSGGPLSFLTNLIADKTKSAGDAAEKDSDLTKLIDLNKCCAKWINEQIEKNPCCILIPIFDDYKKHLSSLDLGSVSTKSSSSDSGLNGDVKKQETSVGEKDTVSKNPSDKKDETPPFSGFKFTKVNTTENAPPRTTLSSESSTFGKSSSFTEMLKKDTLPKSGLTMGSPPAFKGFGLSTEKKTDFSFSAPQKVEQPTEGETKQDDENYEPPTSDFEPVTEEGSVYQIRCKVFEKQKDQFQSMGVGTAYLKPIDPKKFQLLVRTETVLGHILLNVVVTPEHPLQATGKNNVLLMCVPKPDSKPPPIPVLIRVKSEAERDGLLKEMQRLRSEQ